MRETFSNARLVTPEYILVPIAAYRDACESVINKRVAMLTVKSEETRARIDQITIGRHVERHGLVGFPFLMGDVALIKLANSS